jgi:hypothetical protein
MHMLFPTYVCPRILLSQQTLVPTYACQACYYPRNVCPSKYSTFPAHICTQNIFIPAFVVSANASPRILYAGPKILVSQPLFAQQIDCPGKCSSQHMFVPANAYPNVCLSEQMFVTEYACPCTGSSIQLKQHMLVPAYDCSGRYFPPISLSQHSCFSIYLSQEICLHQPMLVLAYDCPKMCLSLHTFVPANNKFIDCNRVYDIPTLNRFFNMFFVCILIVIESTTFRP